MRTIHQRLGYVAIILTIIGGVLIARLLSFQYRLDPEIEEQLYTIASASGGIEVEYQPNRGQIFDRDGQILAVNTLLYRVGISPGAIGPSREEKREYAIEIARILEMSELEVLNRLLPNELGQYPSYVLLKSPVSLEQGAALEALDIPGMVIEPIYQREYPQGKLMSQLLGFVNFESQGYWGVEQYYQSTLAGQSFITTETGLLLDDISRNLLIRDGQDLTLTIDRDAQWEVLQALAKTVEEQEAVGGTVIVMNPETGEILAMVSYPTFTIDEYNAIPQDEKPQFNPAIEMIYEPGSIFKVLTAAAALDSGVADLNWTYTNFGCETIAGGDICDADSLPGASYARGIVPFANCLINSLNTCTAHWLIGGPSYSGVGSDRWYGYLRAFGFGVPTGVDMWGEAAGIVNWPNTPAYGEFNFVQTSFGQGISVTPLQMLTAVNAIANDGLIMQPHIVYSFKDGNTVRLVEPAPISRPISAATAQQVLAIMERAVEDEGPEVWGRLARVEGYRVAGKTGTSQKIIGGQYSDDLSWASFIGFIPADNPQLSILIMIDEPRDYWGSQVAAPLFSEIASRLVVLFEIPPDNLRRQLITDGGNPFGRD
ncbi:MAG: hypothetical protein CUN55_04685 [Phototrophicales bacterium]|nr:MAG: hypothetical protein CUN55_04685 [Phototrophicales bacterium]